ncbi:hypothetical protein PGT21_011257 [Puccinia graminis f. sp. tritici]|uniref:Uncharacterized protein n=1 Tax=Puccinia graminis f. sp. tritici TaxID=56615 RepID=A0A5B0N2L5_PUCGR|nr:hypothetical protein PGT21_011257 [Puccinia graminis f. sp. tritici]
MLMPTDHLVYNQLDPPPWKLELVSGYPLRISAIRWRISASADGYPPADAAADADVPFPLKSWRISGYPSGYPPI